MNSMIAQIALSLLALAPALALTPVNTSGDAKMCFGESHARCFELRGNDYVQTIRDSVAGPVALTPQERARVYLAMRDFKGWAQKAVGKEAEAATAAPCTDIATFKMEKRDERVCLSGINQKTSEAKTRELLKVLESPKIATAKSAAAKTTK